MEDNNLISIIMPTYNCAKYIGLSIESVLVQTYSNWELIIVDDFSSDNTKESINIYLNDKRIKYIKLDENKGAALARNKAIEVANGDYIAFLDSDDIWNKNKLKKAEK